MKTHNTDKTDKVNIEAVKIHIEEDLYPLIAVGAMDREAARFLATHPRELRKWREDRYMETSLLQGETTRDIPSILELF